MDLSLKGFNFTIKPNYGFNLEGKLGNVVFDSIVSPFVSVSGINTLEVRNSNITYAIMDANQTSVTGSFFGDETKTMLAGPRITTSMLELRNVVVNHASTMLTASSAVISYCNFTSECKYICI